MTFFRRPGSTTGAQTARLSLGVLALFAAGCTAPVPVVRGDLEAGRTYYGALAGGAIDRYRVDLAADQALLVEVSQDEVDLVVLISEPGGRVLLRFDSPIGTTAPERVCLVGGIPGIYTVDVGPYAGAGAYTLHALHVRPATENDRRCAAAAAAFATAEGLDAGPERLEHLENAARLWEAAGEPLLAAMTWRQAGSQRLDEGASGQGISCFERALPLARQAGNAPLEVSILNRLGRAYRDAGELGRAAESFDEALVLARKIGDVRGTATTLTNRGVVDEWMGDPHRAVDRYREALELWRREDDPGEIAQALDNLGTVLGVLDHHDEALDVLAEALRLARRTGDVDREANIETGIGWIHYLRGEPWAGLAPLREAEALRRAGDDPRAEAGVLDRLGTVLHAAGQPQAAEETFRRSLAIAKSMDLPGYRAAIEANLGCLLAEIGRSTEAAGYLDRARDYFEGSQDPKSWSQTEYCLARLAREQGDRDAALDHVQRALAIVERLRERARAAGHHYQPIWLWQDYAELEVALLLDRYRSLGEPQDLAAAFAAADQMRARTLYELVVATRTGAERAAGRALEAHAERIQAQLSDLGARRTALLATVGSSSAPTELDAEIRRRRLALQNIHAEMREAARNAGRLGLPQSVSAAEAQRLLDTRTVLLTYVLGAERSHLLTLTRERVEVFELAPRKVLEDHAEGLYYALKGSRKADGQWLLAATALGRLLLPPEAVPPEADRLLIAADGILHYVPFAVLGSPRTASAAGSASRLVFDDFEVVTIPSAAVLAALRQRRLARQPAPKAVAVFADPVFSPADPRVSAAPHPAPAVRPGSAGDRPLSDPLERAISPDRLPEGPLPRLPATAIEATAILARIPASQSLARLGPEATKQAVLSADLGAYRILHFATHAWIDERFPELSGLVLSTVDRAGREIDGALYLHEIDRLDLAADLTVLSGCQTALGRRIRGDGLLGLTQGFFHAGSSQVLVSLWSLDDSGAARLMDEFYRRLLDEGETPAAALRQAQLWLREQHAFRAPRYWAPFVLQGDG